MRILAIDPGSSESAYVVWDGEKVSAKGKLSNPSLQALFQELESLYSIDLLVIERSVIYQTSQDTIHDTIWWYGRFDAIWSCLIGKPVDYLTRSFVVSSLVGKSPLGTNKDSAVRAELIARFGAPGSKSKNNINPITHGMSADIWQAFALAVVWMDRWQRSKEMNKSHSTC